MTLPPLPLEEAIWDDPEHGTVPVGYTAEQMREYGQQCRDDLIELVKAVHKAKGRYHSQLAMCDLYDSCGLPNQRPVK